jgi:hypothetical protein
MFDGYCFRLSQRCSANKAIQQKGFNMVRDGERKKNNMITFGHLSSFAIPEKAQVPGNLCRA